jgi:hypothetical protein
MHMAEPHACIMADVCIVDLGTGVHVIIDGVRAYCGTPSVADIIVYTAQVHASESNANGVMPAWLGIVPSSSTSR